MKIELKDKKVFLNNQGSRKEIHPFWLRERVNGETFVDKKTELDDMFTKNEIVIYENINDLTNKINFYKKNDKLRRKISSAGRKKYFKLFNELKTTKYIIDKYFPEGAKRK